MISSLKSLLGAVGAILLFAGTAFADTLPTIPEPATATLLALGGAGMYLLKGRRRK